MPIANILMKRIRTFFKISKRLTFGLLRIEFIDSGIEKPIRYMNQGNTKSAIVIPIDNNFMINDEIFFMKEIII
jgi:hypothetical protein